MDGGFFDLQLGHGSSAVGEWQASLRDVIMR
jgi:hypothetical protein